MPNNSNNTAGINIFNSQLATNPSIFGGSGRMLGIPSSSQMFTTRETVDNLSGNTMFTSGAINSLSLGSIQANNITGGTIEGTTLQIGNKFSVDSSGNTIMNNATFSGGIIGGWQVSSTSIVSPNGNIVFDATNNRIVLYNAGVPKAVIQG